MGCEAHEQAFNTKLSSVQEALNAELAAIADDTERRAKEISDDFEADNDLAEGVGAVAGTAIGGAFGGVGGAVIGEVVGRTVGSLFTLEVAMHRQTIVLDVPQTRMETRKFSYDLPSVTVSDRDIIFDLPTTEMRRQEGPPIPHTTVRWKNKCVGPRWARICTKVPQVTVKWEKTYLDVPVIVMREQRIVVGVPAVTMKRQEFSLDIPEIGMRPTSMSVDVPGLTLRFVKDAGRRTAARAAALAQSAQEAAMQKQMAFRDRLRSEVAPLALAMFGCYRESLLQARADIGAQYAPEIATLTASLTGLAASSVPADSPDFVAARAALDAVIGNRDAAIADIDKALADLEIQTQQAMAQFLADDDDDDEALLDEDEPEALASAGVGSLVAFAAAA